MAIKFIVDSAADIVPAEAEKMGLVHVPMTVRFGSDEYLDAVELTHSEFYEKLIEGDLLPATSQIPPAVWGEVFERELGDGDEAIVVTVSSKLSGTYQSACIAASGFGGRVHVVDSESVCIGERVLVEYGLELLKSGLGADEVAGRLNVEKKKVRVMALLDTLEYLKRGGRISAAVAFAGGVLGIKPVVTVADGEVTLIGKARGSKQGNNLLRELICKVGGIDFARPFALAYSGLSDKLLHKYINDSKELWAGETEYLPIHTVGCIIGTHVGPGAVAVAFFEK